MLFRGTPVVRGSGEGVVVATGMATELGRIAALAEASGGERTPLEDRLERLGRTLGLVFPFSRALGAGGQAIAQRLAEIAVGKV